MKRRGLSTVVGAVFFVIVMASTISYVAYSLDLIDNLARSVDVKQNENLNRQNEKFEILGVTITPTNKFNVTLHNSGNLPVKITRLFVENTTDSSWNATKYIVDTQLSPGETKHSLVSSLPLIYVDTESYLLTFVTERGNDQKVSVNSGGNQVIHTNLFALPNIIPTGFSTVLLYQVVNNSTGQLVNLVPTVNWTKVCTDCDDPLATSNWQPQSYPSLKPGEVATFQRAYKLVGSEGDLYYFNASLTNAFLGVWDRERVDIEIVSEAQQAGVSITAQGITAGGSDPLSLVLHSETDDTPSSSYQLASTAADAGNNGLVIKYDTSGEKYSWYTNNGTEIINIAGPSNWIAVLQYKSQLVPPSITTLPDMIFFFDNDNYPTSILNSQGDADRDLRPGTSGTCNTNAPTQVTGKHGTTGYNFNSASTQCFESKNTVTSNDENDIDKNNDATAFWFKTNGQMTGSDQYFVNFENSGSNPDYYKVYMTNNGKIAFSYKTKHPSDVITCTSLLEYDDSTWHHVWAQRSEPSNQARCEIYIDYHKDVLNREYVINTIASNFEDALSTAGRWTVGSNKAQNGNFFNGVIDVLMHWDDIPTPANSATYATDLAKTSYGFDAHKLGFEIKRVNHDNSNAGGQPPMTYRTTFFPFHDPTGKPDTDDTAYRNYNYTMSVNDVILNGMPDGHRLNFTIALDSGSNSTWRNHSLDLKIDDENITPFTSYVKLPSEPSNPIPGYTKFDNDDPFQFFFLNGGERGFRFTFSGTRIIFNNTSTGISYGGIPASVNGTTIDEAAYRLSPNEDSIHFPPDSSGHVWFWDARTVPSHSPSKGTLIPPGTYRGAVWVVGYDDEGLSFEKTFDLGIVTIIE